MGPFSIHSALTFRPIASLVKLKILISISRLHNKKFILIGKKKLDTTSWYDCLHGFVMYDISQILVLLFVFLDTYKLLALIPEKFIH